MVPDKTIYDLKLHETLQFDDCGLFTSVLRVPGGWFYRCYDKGNGIATGCFVPYNEDFRFKKE